MTKRAMNTMTQHTKTVLGNQNAEQLPDRKAMSTIDLTSLDVQVSAVSFDDDLRAFADVESDGIGNDGTESNSTDGSSSLHAEDNSLSVGTSVSGTENDNSATELSALLRLDDGDNGDNSDNSGLGLGLGLSSSDIR